MTAFCGNNDMERIIGEKCSELQNKILLTGKKEQARRKHFLSGTATGEGSVGSGDPSARSAEKIFHLHFSVVWIGSRSTFVLCTAKAVPSYEAGGATAPQTRKLASEYNEILFVHRS